MWNCFFELIAPSYFFHDSLNCRMKHTRTTLSWSFIITHAASYYCCANAHARAIVYLMLMFMNIRACVSWKRVERDDGDNRWRHCRPLKPSLIRIAHQGLTDFAGYAFWRAILLICFDHSQQTLLLSIAIFSLFFSPFVNHIQKFNFVGFFIPHLFFYTKLKTFP